jgi:chromosomal replication initiator protein
MDQSAVEDTYAVTRFRPLPDLSTPQPDDILDNLVATLRATVAHAERAAQTLASKTLDRVHAIQQRARRKLAVKEARHKLATPLAPIIEAVESQFRLERGTLIGRRRTQRIAMARQIAMLLCRSITSASYSIIAEAFNRDHSTAIHDCDLIRCRMARDTAFRPFVQRLEHQISQGASTAIGEAASGSRSGFPTTAAA